MMRSRIWRIGTGKASRSRAVMEKVFAFGLEKNNALAFAGLGLGGSIGK